MRYVSACLNLLLLPRYFIRHFLMQVHYRHTVTNKWVLLAVTSANSDALNEHILDLSPYFNAKDGLFTQYLRVKPVGHKNKPCMRIALYGIDSTLCTRSADDHACGADEGECLYSV